VLGVLQSHEIVHESLIRKLAACDEAGARAYAASAVGRWAERLPGAASILAPLAADPHPRVRLQTVVAASYAGSLDAFDLAASAAEQPSDRFLDYAFRQAVHALKPVWRTAL